MPYVGQTVESLKNRKRKHEKDAMSGSGTYFHRALMRYGFDAFEWSVLVECSEDVLSQTEIELIRECHSKKPNGYNLTDGGDGTIGRVMEEWQRELLKNRQFSEDTRRKMSMAAKIRPHRKHSEETRRKIVAANLGRKHTPESRRMMSITRKGRPGKPHTEEAKRKIGEKNRGRKFSDETRRKIGEGNKGKVVSEETRAKLSAITRARTGDPKFKHSELTKRKIGDAHRGRTLDPEHVAKIVSSRAWYGHSDETKAKMSAAAKGRKKTPEAVAKMAASLRGRKLSEEAKIRMRGTWAKKRESRLLAFMLVIYILMEMPLLFALLKSPGGRL